MKYSSEMLPIHVFVIQKHTYYVFHFSFLATIHFTHSQLAICISILKVPSCMADWLGWSNKQLWKFGQHINLNNYN